MEEHDITSNYISISDLYIAYRKAKSEAFFDNMHPNALAFTEYENNLKYNLDKLHKKITSKSFLWEYDQNFIGTYLYVPKSVDDSDWKRGGDVHFRSIDPNEDWLRLFKINGSRKLSVKYRLIISPTVDFQIVSALWILKVGHIFDAKIDDEISFGNRIRRQKNTWHSTKWFGGDINIDCLGLFYPYYSGYRKWRGKGLQVMKTAIQSKKQITAITMDLTSFYHNVSPKFMLRKMFLDQLNIRLTSEERVFTSKLIEAINTWYRNTPDFYDRPRGAIPVGLSASKVISNVLLTELDAHIVNGLSPLYYGRYVDDLFIVMEDSGDYNNGNDVLLSLSKKIECLDIKFVRGKNPELKLKFPYAKDSDLYFTASKQKIFHLSGDYGLDLVDQISSQIRAQSSEYRLLPDIPMSSVQMAEKTLLATPDATLAADALRKADVVSIKRWGFSLLLRDIEQYSRDISRCNWTKTRREFYNLVNRYLLTPKGMFELFTFFPRIFRIMIANYDFKEAAEFINGLEQCLDLVSKTTSGGSKNGRKKLRSCKLYLVKSLIQSALQSSTATKFDKWTDLGRILRQLFLIDAASKTASTKPSLIKISRKLLLADMGSRPYKDYWYYQQKEDIRIVPVPRSTSIRKALRLALIKKFRISSHLKVPHWPALTFPTRPLTIQEIALISPSVLKDIKLLAQAIKGLRGAGTWESRKIGFYHKNDDYYLYIPREPGEFVNIAVTNILTTNEQWLKALRRTPDRSLNRYKKFTNLINSILKQNVQPDYILFPELALPRRWAIGFASKLAKRGISLISGIEYYNQIKAKSTLRNDCLISLSTDWPGYRSNFIFMQPKLSPSHEEKGAIYDVNKKLFSPNPSESLPIYKHGDFFFGVLICSDFTTPANRVKFQGKIDSLFVLEWNPDVKTFSFLIEGAAHDIHAFVIQVNNRQYGDSRVRAPYYQDFKRDSMRLKGGIEDGFIVDKIDYKKLRVFQTRSLSRIAKYDIQNGSNPEYKPLPIGFQISSERKVFRLKRKR